MGKPDLTFTDGKKMIGVNTIMNGWESQYKGLSFKDFWNKLPNKLTYFDYEEELENDLKNHKYIWIKKATGLGISEFMLRWIAWNCLKDDELKNKQVDVSAVIITGPRIELAVQLIDRLKELFEEEFETKNTICYLNGCKIEAFPSHHLATARGLNPFLVFLDEADYFPKGQQEEARAVSERYIAKSDPFIVMVSTPYLPDGLYEKIEKEDPCLYFKKFMHYDIGVGKIYTEEMIEKAKESRHFKREYELHYGYGVGNIFPHELLKYCIEEYDLSLGNGQKGLYVDPAYGNSDVSSKFGMMGFEKKDGILYVKLAQQYARASPSAMFEIVKMEAQKFGNHVRVDSAHPGLIRDLRDSGVICSEVVFSKELPEMVGVASQMVREKKVKIHPAFREAISQLVSVETNERGNPDKKKLTFDLGDCFIMGCKDLKENNIRIIKV